MQLHVEEPGVTFEGDLLPALFVLEGRAQQPLADGGGEVHPRVPAQLDAERHARATPRCGVHDGGWRRRRRRREAGTCCDAAAARVLVCHPACSFATSNVLGLLS